MLETREDVKKLDRVFNPQTVAVVGDKRGLNYMWLRSLSAFKGKVYSVQIDPKEIPGVEALGFENHLSLLDIPEPVDYVIVSVPRSVAPQIVQECIKAKVGGVALFTSGFAETGTEEGIRLQKVITEMAQKAGLNLIGPNCMGIFNPKLGLKHSPDQYAGESGPVGFISQSGTHAGQFSVVGALSGVKISKSVSYGNAVALDSTDYLEYLAQDEETKIIGMYIEGVKDGRRFFECLRETTREKPVLIWKGGQTKEGSRATASHTGVLAESDLIWNTLIKQCGALKVDSLEEMVDTAQALVCLKPGCGTSVGLMAMTGGQSVVITDTFSKAGLEVPLLSEQSYQRLASFFNIIGGSYQNPLDIATSFYWVGDPAGNLATMLEVLEEDPKVDALVLELSVAFGGRLTNDPQFQEAILNTLSDFKNRSRKPFLVILVAGHREALALETRGRLVERGIASFPTFERGARALKKVVEYYKFRDS